MVAAPRSACSLGVTTTLREDECGGVYEVPLLDTAYVRNFSRGCVQELTARRSASRSCGKLESATFQASLGATARTRKPCATVKSR